MAGGPGLFDLNEQRILIAIVQDFLHALDVPGCLSLLPETAARPAPETGEARLDRPLDRFGVHVSNHQDLFAAPVLNDRGNQPFFIIFQVIGDMH